MKKNERFEYKVKLLAETIVNDLNSEINQERLEEFVSIFDKELYLLIDKDFNNEVDYYLFSITHYKNEITLQYKRFYNTEWITVIIPIYRLFNRCRVLIIPNSRVHEVWTTRHNTIANWARSSDSYKTLNKSRQTNYIIPL